MHRISLEQWSMFIAVVDNGGFAQAGDALFKTQSTISHSIKKLESTVGKQLFEVVGRKAALTPYGDSLLTAARTLIGHADALEHDAISQHREIRTTFNLAVDILFPTAQLWSALSRLSTDFPELNIQLHETVLSRCGELLDDGTVDVGIASSIPKGYVSQLVTTVDLFAVAHESHSVMKDKAHTLNKLEQHRQFVIRDAGLRNNVNSGWLGSASRLTVSNLEQAWQGIQQQIGFAWLPLWFLRQKSTSDVVRLKLENGHMRTVALQLAVRPELASNQVVRKFVNYLMESQE
ncbi:LysR family transcriptional regulator [Bowmanella yangjiangensis]|uniref:LysR family transcriptional regulator n=1 Tax=Bowmanella yangjiangensis TaxID=2811230 RepID=A0ABS3CRK7_9ALTE|nr:LysR family transcriptional regulator [Bowmanella yangjiangensis]MBN7819741.1 LysR family transcriptional regulator [Bowmanella yangjiangensis]